MLQPETKPTFKAEFYIDNKSYFKGGTLGPLTRRAEEICQQTFEGWQQKGLYGMFDYGWVHCDDPVRQKASQILGCSKEEVAFPSQHCFNIHIMLTKMYHPVADGGHQIVIDSPLSCTLDIQSIQSQMKLQGQNSQSLHIIKSTENIYTTEQDIIDYLELNHQKVSIVFVQSINPITGYAYDIEKLTKRVHELNILIGFDLTQSVGTQDLQLNNWDVDFAVFSSQCYLSGGLNCTSGIYWNKKHFEITHKQLSGWFGNKHETQFEMKHQFEPAKDAQMLNTSGLSPFNLKIIEKTLDIIQEETIEKILSDCHHLMQILFSGLKEIQKNKKVANEENLFQLITPEANIGNTLCIRLSSQYQSNEICQKLKEKNIEVNSYGEMNLLVISLYSLYNSTQDVEYFVNQIKIALD